MVQYSTLDDGFTAAVLRETNEGWRNVFRDAVDYQDRNPDVRAAALSTPSDHVEGGRTLVPALAMLHPLVLRRCMAYLDFIDDRLDRLDGTDPVPPPRDTPEQVFVAVEGGRMSDRGGQQQDDRLAEAQAENERLRAELAQLVRTHEADREIIRSAFTLLRMRLDAID